MNKKQTWMITTKTTTIANQNKDSNKKWIKCYFYDFLISIIAYQVTFQLCLSCLDM